MREERDWIIAQLKATGVSQVALAAAMGLDASKLSKTLHGRRKLQIDEARRARRYFESLTAARGFAEGDAQPWTAAPRATPNGRLTTWRVSRHMPGFLLQAGDLVRVDPAARPVPGDLVLANVPDEEGTGTVTILRRFAPGWYVSDDWRNLEAALPGTLVGVVRDVVRVLRPDDPQALPPQEA